MNSERDTLILAAVNCLILKKKKAHFQDLKSSSKQILNRVKREISIPLIEVGKLAELEREHQWKIWVSVLLLKLEIKY